MESCILNGIHVLHKYVKKRFRFIGTLSYSYTVKNKEKYRTFLVCFGGFGGFAACLVEEASGKGTFLIIVHFMTSYYFSLKKICWSSLTFFWLSLPFVSIVVDISVELSLVTLLQVKKLVFNDRGRQRENSM